MKALTHLDLFSGIGGFALAAEWAGFKTIGFSEIDPYANKILSKHWPQIKNYGDITNVRGIQADLVTGGFPCQPFSVAGRRRGKEDDRYLWPEMCRVIEESRPAWVLGENVAGIIHMELDEVLSDMECLGYEARAFVIPACAVDAPHRRDRVWIVAHADRFFRGTRSDGRKPSACSAADNEPSGSDQGSESVAHASLGKTRGLQQQGISANIGAGCHWSKEACQWSVEPAVGRVAHGIPNRTHRLRGLGNAIVPQAAVQILSGIMEIAHR